MSCDNVITVQDLETDKKHSTFYREVITGKAGGTGAYIDFATNAVTGQAQKTLSATIDGLDWSFVGKFADGVTFTKKTDFAIDASGTQWIYVGTSPFPVVVPSGTVPSAPNYQVAHVGTLQALGGLTEPSDLDQVHTRTFADVAAMLAFNGLVEGRRYSTGGTTWEYAGGGSTIDNFKKLNRASDMLTNLIFYPYDESDTLANGDTVPSGTTALRIHNSIWILISPIPFFTGWNGATTGGVVSGINLGTRRITIGSQVFEIGEAAYNIVDKVNTSTSTLNIEHYSNGSGSPNGSTYGIDLHNNVGAQSAVVIHQYSNVGPAVQIDNTHNKPSILINNTANPTRNPAGPSISGEGDYLYFAINGSPKLQLDKNFTWKPKGGKAFQIIPGDTGTIGLDVQTGIGSAVDTMRVVRANATGYAIKCANESLATTFGILGDGTPLIIDANTSVTVGGAGVSAPTPAAPERYWKVKISGVDYKIPCYKA